MKKNYTKKHLIEFCFILIFFLLPIPVMGSLECTVDTSCSNTTIFRISDPNNGHAEIPSESNYNYLVCCRDTGGATIGNTCSGTYAIILHLSDTTNAHVEKNTESNYNINVCISTSEDIECGYGSSCDGWDTCVASISGDTNAHVGDCNAYSTKICCNVLITGTSSTTTITTTTTPTTTTPKGPSKSPFCCQTAPKSGQKRCYSSGYCCDKGQVDEYWSPDPCDISSYNFKMWIAGPSMYTVGQKIQVILYLQNVGEYRDSYDITFTNSNPTLILVDSSGISPVDDVEPEEIRFVYPRITVLASTAIGDVIFKGTSKTITSITKEASLHIVSETPMSLPEFEVLGFIWIIILAGFFYFTNNFS